MEIWNELSLQSELYDESYDFARPRHANSLKFVGRIEKRKQRHASRSEGPCYEINTCLRVRIRRYDKEDNQAPDI